MKKLLLAFAMLLGISTVAMAQRFTDNLDRGLVAVPTGSTSGSTSNMVTWRRLANEYYGVTYNLYKNGTKVASNLTTTCYDDSKSAPITTTYQVAAVVNGVEQTPCTAVTPWAQYVYQYSVRCPTGYLDIDLAPVYDRDGNNVTGHYQPNDAEMADLDGDGQLEIIIKRLNTVDAAGYDSGLDDKNGNDRYIIYPKESKEFVVLDAYDVDWQTGNASLMWRIDCGPNMVSANSTEINIIAYDWDEDGIAEVVLRGADNMIIYDSDGQTRLHNIGNMNVNTRETWYTSNENGSSTGSLAYTHSGAEYLIYMDGLTGALYQQIDYPLTRESAEAWGDGSGHRSSKYFMGAPFLDGRKASLFLGRGIYTRHKMIAMDLDRDNHTWSETWRWNCNDSSSPWYGQGNHNFVIADVDEDGCDEIVYGSMVIDNNGNGLSTTGLGHGDAMHVSDFDPYRKGLEVFACNESSPKMNYRNATTSNYYYRLTGSGDDGRALMANFSNNYPGSLGRSIASGMISSVTDTPIEELSGDSYIPWGDLNFRIYWDGDLCSEILDSPGTAKEAKVDKPGTGRLFTSSGCNMNNDSKNNPCFQGDIIGDWREEIVVRRETGLRVYTTGMSTSYSLPCLWYDHQYRQAMVWQMMAYNQPPHLSYFLGEMEGITVAPPPLTMEGRTEIEDGGTITSSNNGEHVLLCDASSVGIASDGVSPQVITVNVNSVVSGNDDNNNIDYWYNTTQLGDGSGKGDISGATRLVKQGDGRLELTNRTFSYTGNTDIWGGTLRFDGTLQSSPVWLNRFAALESAGGKFNGGITADYEARIIPGGENEVGSITTSTLTMNFGSRLVIDLNNDLTNDQVNATTLTINTKKGDDVWENYGPAYLTPVIEFVQQDGGLDNATYVLGNVGTVTGSLDDIVIEGLSTSDYSLTHSNGQLILTLGTGISTTCSTAIVTESGWQTNSEGVLMPTVDITANAFDYGSNSVTPALSATFTDLDNNTEDVSLYRTLFSEDFEDSTSPADYWKNVKGGIITTPTYANSSNQCIAIQHNEDSGGYTEIEADYNGVDNYAMEFDTYFNNASRPTNFVVMSKSHLNSWLYNWGYRWKGQGNDVHNPYLLYLMRDPSSTTFYVNETSTTITLNNSTWYHFTLNVDIAERTVEYSITQKGNTTVVASGQYALPDGESAECDGIYVRNGRYNYEPGGVGIDNIHIYATNPASYAFTEPGTLTVTSSYTGCQSTETTYECNYIGAEIGEAGWSTLGCNYPLDLSGSGLPTAYVVSELNSGYAKLQTVTSVPASTGLLLEGAKGIYEIPITGSATLPTSNLLTAVTDADGYTVSNSTTYVLANTATYGTGFYQGQQGLVIPAGKAYLTVPAGSREVILIGEATGIDDAARLTNSEKANSEVYNLNGQRLRVGDQRSGMRLRLGDQRSGILPLRKGIYIVGGQKIVIR